MKPYTRGEFEDWDDVLGNLTEIAKQRDKLKRRYWIVVAIAALGWLLALMAIMELLSLYL